MVEDIAFPPDAGLSVQCSARRCRAAAAYQLRWNNPRLHAADARKIWLACPEHRESLSDFLRARRFLREVEPFPPAPDSPDSDSPGAGPVTDSTSVTDAGSA